MRNMKDDQININNSNKIDNKNSNKNSIKMNQIFVISVKFGVDLVLFQGNPEFGQNQEFF